MLWQGQSVIDLTRDQLHRERVREFGQAQHQNERLTQHSNYDPQSRLETLSIGRGAHILRRCQYHYDSIGNLTNIADSKRGDLSYRYDPLGQLLTAVQAGIAENFAFAPAGNLLDPEAKPLAKTLHASQEGEPRELQNQPEPWKGPDRRAEFRLSKLARVTHNLLQSYIGNQFEYDVQGNTIIKRQRYNNASANESVDLHLAYDDENRLISATKSWYQSRMVAEYGYDAFNRRIGKRITEQSWAAGKTMEDEPPNQTKTTSKKSILPKK